MNVGRALTLAAVCLVASACYHQQVMSGRTPGTTIVAKPWTPTWIFGLVPATPIDVTQQCGRAGVAIVETQQTVPNWLVGLVTLGIFTPIDVKVTCARLGIVTQRRDVLRCTRRISIAAGSGVRGSRRGIAADPTRCSHSLLNRPLNTREDYNAS